MFGAFNGANGIQQRASSTPDIGLLGQTASDNEIHVHEALVIDR